jgi:STE24 endopeptidase
MIRSLARAGLFLGLMLWFAVPSAAEDSPVLTIPPGAAAGPDFDVERATQAWIDTLSPEQRAKSDAYFEGGYALQVVGFLYGLGIAAVLLMTSLSRRMRALAERVSTRPFVRTVIYAAQYVVVVSALGLPLDLYEDFYREHAYGLATNTLGEWLGDQAKLLLIAVVFGSVLFGLLYLVFRKAPRMWWALGTGVAVVFSAFTVMISPVYVEPLFNEYNPVPAGPLKERILSMARANGVPANDVMWFDASKRTKRISANVNGLFGTTRIALNDNLMNRSPEEGIEAVLAHEIGHYVLGHALKGLIAGSVLLLAGFAFTKRVFDMAVARWGPRLSISGIGDVGGLPLFVAIVSVWLFLLTPVTNTLIRTMEAEADMYGLNAARQPDGAAGVAMQLSEYRKIRPGRLEELVFFDHPSGWNRVHRAMAWKKENP